MHDEDGQWLVVLRRFDQIVQVPFAVEIALNLQTRFEHLDLAHDQLTVVQALFVVMQDCRGNLKNGRARRIVVAEKFEIVDGNAAQYTQSGRLNVHINVDESIGELFG